MPLCMCPPAALMDGPPRPLSGCAGCVHTVCICCVDTTSRPVSGCRRASFRCANGSGGGDPARVMQALTGGGILRAWLPCGNSLGLS